MNKTSCSIEERIIDAKQRHIKRTWKNPQVLYLGKKEMLDLKIATLKVAGSEIKDGSLHFNILRMLDMKVFELQAENHLNVALNMEEEQT